MMTGNDTKMIRYDLDIFLYHCSKKVIIICSLLTENTLSWGMISALIDILMSYCAFYVHVGDISANNYEKMSVTFISRKM